MIGGFSKSPGGPPDIYHSYLGLAILAMMGEPELKELDVALCCSKDTARKIELAREGISVGGQQMSGLDWQNDGFWDKALAI